MQSIDSKETNVYGTRKDLVSEKEEIKCGNIIKRYKSDDDVTREILRERERSCVSGKTN